MIKKNLMIAAIGTWLDGGGKLVVPIKIGQPVDNADDPGVDLMVWLVGLTCWLVVAAVAKIEKLADDWCLAAAGEWWAGADPGSGRPGRGRRGRARLNWNLVRVDWLSKVDWNCCSKFGIVELVVNSLGQQQWAGAWSWRRQKLIMVIKLILVVG